ncbi:LppU/SCO3897 family protein [Streptomyces cinereospinus]|uniref:Ig-like domain-containing protein n=1 Tax=Streptomyces cinereospinus TaxID=285561 RepID=A0ABV5MTD2_9ACTN
MTTTPPQGNPFAQGQNPYAQGQQPYGQPQGQAPFPPQGAVPTVPVAPQRPRRGIKQYLRIAVVVAGLIFAAVGWYVGNDDTKQLAVGDCLTNKGSDESPEIEQLDCTDTKAQYKVLKKDDSTSLSMLACQSVQGTTAAIEWTEGSDSFVLCLGDNK